MHNSIELLEESSAVLHFYMTDLDGFSTQGCNSENKDFGSKHNSLLPVACLQVKALSTHAMHDHHFHRLGKRVKLD